MSKPRTIGAARRIAALLAGAAAMRALASDFESGRSPARRDLLALGLDPRDFRHS